MEACDFCVYNDYDYCRFAGQVKIKETEKGLVDKCSAFCLDESAVKNRYKLTVEEANMECDKRNNNLKKGE